MKATMNIDCTPEEARAFLGLRDVQPMQEHLMKEIKSDFHQAQAKCTSPGE
jgi:hypothetical protein